MSKITQDVIALNDYTQERRRTTSRGTKSRYTITINAQPILHNLSEEHLGVGPAEAIQQAIVKQIKAIADVARPATILRRQNSAKAFAAGKPSKSDRKRYAGGRTGLKEPSGSVRLFNDSGRLADGILVKQNPKEKNWTINVTANRLDPSTFRSQAQFMTMVERLYAYVPVLGKPLDHPDVIKAIEGGVRNVLLKRVDQMNVLGEQAAALKAEIAKMRAQAIQQVASLIAQFL